MPTRAGRGHRTDLKFLHVQKLGLKFQTISELLQNSGKILTKNWKVISFQNEPMLVSLLHVKIFYCDIPTEVH